MSYLKPVIAATIAVLATGLLAFAGPAVATVLTDGSGAQLKTGTMITAESEGTTIFHPPIGDVECETSHLAGKTTSESGTIGIALESFYWETCNAELTTLKVGSLSIVHTSGSNGTLTSTGTELTTVFAGFHCIFSTNNTKFGTITGGTPATLDIEVTIPRTGGSSGIFCGSTYQWTGTYKVTAPSTLNID